MLKKEKVIYKREYNEKKLDEYDKLVAKIKENSFDDIQYKNGDALKAKYIIFDGIFLTRVIFNLSRGYNQKNWETQAIVEKMGKDTSKISDIEKLILENGFKKE